MQFRSVQSTTLSVTAAGAAGTQGITCTGGLDAHVDFFGPSLASGNSIATITALDFLPSCVVAGFSAAVKCTNTASSMSVLNDVSYDAGTSTSTGTITGIHCIVVRLGSCGNATTFNATGSTTGEGITVSGSVGATYGNTTHQLTILNNAQSLNAKVVISLLPTGHGHGHGDRAVRPDGRRQRRPEPGRRL
ncbi:MAG: hypothetical protein JWR63_886 [Conexibacter sp.]|nr:hypothetical protein [Conexibacter sp.]